MGDETDGYLAWLRSISEPTAALEAVAPDPLASIPLAGDLVAAAAQVFGVQWLTEYVAGQLGVDCGCSGRRDLLNRLDRSLRRRLRWANS